MRKLALTFYYIFLINLPHSTIPVFGVFCERFREFIVKFIFKKSGNNINIGKGARFGSGKDIVIGNNSGLGMYCKIPNNIIIGKDVMMGPNVLILSTDHNIERIDIPMISQGFKKKSQVIIEDDVWIGSNAIILSNLKIKKGTIIAAGSVVTKNFPEYSIVGGNPAKLIRSRIGN